MFHSLRKAKCRSAESDLATPMSQCHVPRKCLIISLFGISSQETRTDTFYKSVWVKFTYPRVHR